VQENIFSESVIARLGPNPITATMLGSALVSLALVALMVWLRAQLTRRSEGAAAALALFTVEWLDQLVCDVCGRPEPRLVSLSGSLFLFIAACNLMGQLPGVAAPTTSLATTSALAVLVFFAVPVAGIRARGWRAYFARYFQPSFFLAPLHVVSELSRTLALSVRLFGNMMSGHLVVGLLVALTGFLVPMPLMALDLLIGLLQAYIFTILSTVYVGSALRNEYGE